MQHAENDLLQDSELPSSTSARPSRVVGARRCCRSLAGCLPHGLGEAAGPKGRSIRRPQWLAGLQGHDGNCHRHGDASGAKIRFVIVSTRRGCCFAIFAYGPAQWSCPLLSTISRLSCASTGRVCTRSKWSWRGMRAWAGEGCWQSPTRRCGGLSLQGMMQAAKAAVFMPRARSRTCFFASVLGGVLNSEHRHELPSCCPMMLCLCACVVAHEEHVVHVREYHGAVGIASERCRLRGQDRY